jgi:hypothetical protein
MGLGGEFQAFQTLGGNLIHERADRLLMTALVSNSLVDNAAADVRADMQT